MTKGERDPKRVFIFWIISLHDNSLTLTCARFSNLKIIDVYLVKSIRFFKFFKGVPQNLEILCCKRKKIVEHCPKLTEKNFFQLKRVWFA